MQAGDNARTSTENMAQNTMQFPLVSQCASVPSVPYRITLESKTDNGNGTYTWIWSVENKNPGNGNGGTFQDLSHWNIQLANNCCPAPVNPCGGIKAQLSDVVSAATSTNGTSWQSFSPTLKPDPSIRKCNAPIGAQSVPMLKFDVGTNGTAKTYYKLVLSDDFGVDVSAVSIYKSGSRTQCGLICSPTQKLI